MKEFNEAEGRVGGKLKARKEMRSIDHVTGRRSLWLALLDAWQPGLAFAVAGLDSAGLLQSWLRRVCLTLPHEHVAVTMGLKGRRQRADTPAYLT